MKATIEVKDKAEREALRAGLADKEVRAFAVVAGLLLALPTDRARTRVLEFVRDRLAEEQEAKQEST